MSHQIRRVCVYCASSRKADGAYFDAADRLGRPLARHRVTVVYGRSSLAYRVSVYRELVLPMAPVSRLTACMSDRNNLDLFATFSINYEVGKPTKRDAPRAVLGTDARNWVTEPWMTQDQVENPADFCKESHAQTLLPHLIPSHRGPQFILGRRINTEAFHFESNSFSIRRRTSCQSEVTASPASNAAHRRSISTAQASSASGSTSWSRLWIRRVASSARWSSGKARAS